MRRSSWAGTLVLLLSGLPAGADDYRLKVADAKDGDTVVIEGKGGATSEVDLYGIDAPEKMQSGGEKAGHLVSKLTRGELLPIRPMGRRNGVPMVSIYLEDGRDLSEVLVGEGLAWWDFKFAPDALELKRLQESAKSERRGIWRDERPEPPWRFRGERRPGDGYDPKVVVLELSFPRARADEFSLHPQLHMMLSRTRALVILADGVTRARLEELLGEIAPAGTNIVGSMEGPNIHLLEVPDPGDHSIIDQLVDALNDAPEVDSASHDVLLSAL